MKRLLKITLLLTALALAALAVWRLTGPHGVGELYKRYSGQEGVRVGFVKNYPFDDSTKVDVTTVEALDTAGWSWMQAEFDLPSPDPRRAALLADGGDAILSMPYGAEGRFLFLSYRDRKLCIVDTRTNSEYRSILLHHLELLTK